MSFPYTTTSPPPTSGALTVVDKANESQPYAGGGGGGGPIGPNPVVSTLTVSNTGYVALQDANTPTDNWRMLPGQTELYNTTQDYNIAFITTSFGGVYADVAVGRLAVCGQISTGVFEKAPFIDAGNGTQDGILYIGANGVSTASLYVSSINGATPGTSSVPADLSVSSINFSTSGFLQMSGGLGFVDNSTQAINDGGFFMGLPANQLNAGLGTSLVNGITFTSPSALGTSASFAASDALGMILVAADSVNGGLSSMSLLADGVHISSLNVSSINGQIPGGAAVPPNLGLSTLFVQGTASVSTLTGIGSALVIDGQGQSVTIAASDLNIPAAPTNISSLNVSSINGASYPPPAGGLQFSTINIPGGAGVSTFDLTAGAANSLVSFSTIAGHTYSASVGARAQFPNAPPADIDIIFSEIVDDGVGNEAIGSWPLSQVSTFSAGSINQEVGGTVNWKAGGTGCAFSLYPTAAGATARVDRLVVIDYGAI